jgi:hypothetical protein
MDTNTETNQINSLPEEDSSADVNKKILGASTFLTKLLGLALLLILIFTFVLSFQKGGIVKQQEDTTSKVADIQSQIKAFSGDKVVASENALDALKMIEKEEIRWSEVIEAINKLIPKDSKGADKIKILSYNGSAGGKISLSAVTNPQAEPPFGDVSELLSVFNSNLYFKDVFIPSISKGLNQEKKAQLSFMLNLYYQEPDLSVGGETASSTTASSAAAVPSVSTGTPKTSVAVPKIPANK